MAERVPLSGSHWAEIREATSLRAGDKLDLIAAARELPGESTVAMMTALFQRMVTNWQVSDEGETPLPIPAVMPGVVRQLSIADYDALTEAVRPSLDVLFPKAQPRDGAEAAAQQADPESPTPPVAV